MAKTNVKGHTGLLSIFLTAGYKPVVCLTSTSMDRVSEMTEKVNYCTEGETVSSVDRITRTVNLDGEVVTIDEADNGATYDDLVAAMESKQEQRFKIEGRGSTQYFKAVIASLGDNFTAGDDATFSGQLNVNGEITETDPEE